MTPKPTDFHPVQALEQLAAQLKPAKSLLILTHNHPDPDAMASGMALHLLANKFWVSKATLAYAGIVGRAENIALLKECRIPLKPISRLKPNSYDQIALVDTQPRAGNHALPSRDVHITIDHHPVYRTHRAELNLIDTGVGASATLMIELFQASGTAIPVDLATALTYAIRSETQDLGRETSKRDIQAFFHVYSLASMKKLSRIAYPSLPREYYLSLSRTLKKTLVFRHLILAHTGPVPTPEIVSEMADMLVRHKGISWSLVTGRFKDNLLLSIRSTNPHAKAGKLIKKLVPVSSNAGGHDSFAGGRISIDKLSGGEINTLEKKLTEKFAALMGYKQAEWKSLMEKSSSD
jgi:nanoRNase/pAp phosphatase (c-di-AMP/oligoRNAs hydrolase)